MRLRCKTVCPDPSNCLLSLAHFFFIRAIQKHVILVSKLCTNSYIVLRLTIGYQFVLIYEVLI